MTSRTLLTTLLTLVPLVARAQDAADADPLARVRELASSNEVVMFWSQGSAVDLQQSTFKIYDVDLTRELDQALTSGPRMEDSLIGGRKGLTLATGNFTDGPLKHIVAAWVRPDSTIELIVPGIDGGTLSWTTANRLTIPVGDFDYDTADEIAFAFCYFQGEETGPDTYVYLTNVSSDLSGGVIGPAGAHNVAPLAFQKGNCFI